jgi:hypothetical protein
VNVNVNVMYVSIDTHTVLDSIINHSKSTELNQPILNIWKLLSGHFDVSFPVLLSTVQVSKGDIMVILPWAIVMKHP